MAAGLILALAVTPMLGQATPTDTSKVVVEVTGHGATLWQARLDAIRQALQQTMRQLVIADRAVSSSAVLRDQVLSTLNGFVDRYDVLAEDCTDTLCSQSARVTVSGTRINNFIAITGPAPTAAVNGDAMVARMQALQLGSRTRREIIERLFEGFPDRTVTLKVRGYDQVGSGAESVRLVIDIRFDTAFVNSLKEGLVALGATTKLCRSPYSESHTEDGSSFRLDTPDLEKRTTRGANYGEDADVLHLCEPIDALKLPKLDVNRYEARGNQSHGNPFEYAADNVVSAAVYTPDRLALVLLTIGLPPKTDRGMPGSYIGCIGLGELWSTQPTNGRTGVGGVCLPASVFSGWADVPTAFFDKAANVSIALINGHDCQVTQRDLCTSVLRAATGNNWILDSTSMACAIAFPGMSRCYWKRATQKSP